MTENAEWVRKRQGQNCSAKAWEAFRAVHPTATSAFCLSVKSFRSSRGTKTQEVSTRGGPFSADSRHSLSEFSDSKYTMILRDFFFGFFFFFGPGRSPAAPDYQKGTTMDLHAFCPLQLSNHQSSHFPRTYIKFWLRYNWHPLINYLLYSLVFLRCHLFYHHRDSDLIISSVKTTV